MLKQDEGWDGEEGWLTMLPVGGGARAVGAYVIENGTGKTLKARKGVVVSAGGRQTRRAWS